MNTIYEQGGIVSAVCHGVAALLNVKDAGGTFLLQNKNVTGFSNVEEVLAKRDTMIPFHLQNEIKHRGASYHFGRVPFTSTLEVDDRIITGQNPQSPSQVAEAVKTTLILIKSKARIFYFCEQVSRRYVLFKIYSFMNFTTV